MINYLVSRMVLTIVINSLLHQRLKSLQIVIRLHFSYNFYFLICKSLYVYLYFVFLVAVLLYLFIYKVQSCFGIYYNYCSTVHHLVKLKKFFLDKATSNLRLDPDWPTILQICDLIRQNDCS